VAEAFLEQVCVRLKATAENMQLKGTNAIHGRSPSQTMTIKVRSLQQPSLPSPLLTVADAESEIVLTLIPDALQANAYSYFIAHIRSANL